MGSDEEGLFLGEAQSVQRAEERQTPGKLKPLEGGPWGQGPCCPHFSEEIPKNGLAAASHNLWRGGLC